jgi:hypothetical protein
VDPPAPQLAAAAGLPAYYRGYDHELNRDLAVAGRKVAPGAMNSVLKVLLKHDLSPPLKPIAPRCCLRLISLDRCSCSPTQCASSWCAHGSSCACAARAIRGNGGGRGDALPRDQACF